jgi:hypothetical protein
MSAAGAGLTSLFSSISNSLHSPATTSAPTTINSTSVLSPSYGNYGTSAYGATAVTTYGTSLTTHTDSITGHRSILSGYEPTVSSYETNKIGYGAYGSDLSGFDATKYGLESAKYESKFGEMKFGSESLSYKEDSKFGSDLSKFGLETSKYDSEISKFSSDLSKYDMEVNKVGLDMSKYGLDGYGASKFTPEVSKYDSGLSKYGLDSKFDLETTKFDLETTKEPSTNDFLSKYDLDLSKYAPKPAAVEEEKPLDQTASSILSKFDLSKFEASLSSFNGLSTSSYEPITSSYGITTSLGGFDSYTSATSTGLDVTSSSPYGIVSSATSTYGLTTSTFTNSYEPVTTSSYGVISTSSYDPITSSFGAVTSTYDPITSEYGAISSSYDPLKNNSYGIVTSSYDPMTSSYGAVTSSNDPMLSSYGTASSGFEPVTSTFDSTYGISNVTTSSYNIPSSQYGAVTSGYGSTNSTFDASSYGIATTTTTSAPVSTHNTYGIPSYSAAITSTVTTTASSTSFVSSLFGGLKSSVSGLIAVTSSSDTTTTKEVISTSSSFGGTSNTSIFGSSLANLTGTGSVFGPISNVSTSAPVVTSDSLYDNSTYAPSTGISTSSYNFKPLSYDTTSDISASTTMPAITVSAPYGTSTYGMTSIGLLGHSPIPEEDVEHLDEEEIIDEFADPYTLDGDYIEPFVPATQSYTSDGYTSFTNTDTYTNLTIPTSAASMINSMRRISDPYAHLNEVIDEYHEDFEEGVEPQPVITVTEDFSKTTTVTTGAQQQFASYPLSSRLSTIHESSSDVYLSPNETSYEDQVTPTAYDYTENENDYIASGDLKNLNQSNNYAPYSTAPSTVAAAVTQQQQQQQQAGQKKSLFGSFISGGLGVLGSSVNVVKATATNLAATAVGAAGVAAGAVSAKTGPQGQVNVSQQNFISTASSTQQQDYSQSYSQQNGPYATSNIYTTAANTLTTSMDAQNANYNQQQQQQKAPPISQTKLIKQATSIYDPPDEQYYDQNAYGNSMDHDDYFNEEDEELYMKEHLHSPDNYDNYIDNNNFHNRKIKRNDTNNNEGDYGYGYEDDRRKMSGGLNDDYYGENKTISFLSF